MARDRSDFLYIMDMPWPAALMAALCACLFFGLIGARAVYKPYRIPSGSMQPTLRVGDYMIVDKLAFSGAGTPQRDDLVIYRDPELRVDFVKRVVGVRGDRVQVIDGVLTLNGAPVTVRAIGAMTLVENGEPQEFDAFEEKIGAGAAHVVLDRYDSPGDDTGIYEIGSHQVFLLGDDRDNSRDSRFEVGGFGAVEEADLGGRVVHIFPAGQR